MGKMNWIVTIAAIFLYGYSLTAHAQSRDAYYPFDGNLSDAGGGGYDGTMIAKGGMPALAQFAEGLTGQALQLDGRTAMRAYLDLNPELCPQVTVTGWIRVESYDVTGTQYLLSTGSGSGPSLRTSGSIVTLSGLGNGISHRDALRDGRAWFFFAAVHDNEAETYRFHWRDRVVESGLAGPRRPVFVKIVDRFCQPTSCNLSPCSIAGLSGFNITIDGLDQFRIAPLQRPGFLAFACS